MIKARKCKIDPNTYGNSKAAIDLVDILNRSDDIKSTNKIRRILGRQMQTLDHLMEIKDLRTRQTAIRLFHRTFKEALLKKAIDPKMKSYLYNIENTFCKTLINVGK
jgi:hypothetical protein